MKALVLVLTLIAGFSVSAADKQLPTKIEPKPAAATDDGSKPLALPDSTLVERYQGSSDRKLTQICTSPEGRTFKQDESGYNDCLGRLKSNSMEVNGKNPNAARQNPLDKRDSTGVSFQFGK